MKWVQEGQWLIRSRALVPHPDELAQAVIALNVPLAPEGITSQVEEVLSFTSATLSELPQRADRHLYGPP